MYFDMGMSIVCKFGVIIYCLVMEWNGCFVCIWFDLEQCEDYFFGVEFQVEFYLQGYVECFVCMFDFNSYLYLLCVSDWFDVVEYGGGSVCEGFKCIYIEWVMVIGVSIDILFLLEQQEQIVDGLCDVGVVVEFVVFDLLQGYDVFLVDIVNYSLVIGGFLQWF